MFLPEIVVRYGCRFFNLLQTNAAAPKIPDIITAEETLKYLSSSNAGICRFGDGELNLINGKSIPFQKSSFKIRRRLIEVLTSDKENILIGIPRIAFTLDADITPENKLFWQKKGKRFRRILHRFLQPERTYCASEVSLLYSYIAEYDFKNYFTEFRTIWNDKDIAIVTGRTVFDKLRHNIFDNARSVEYIYAPSRNAFEEYDDILQRTLQTDKNKLIIAILGPTATILAWDLLNRGYRTLDLGHIAKSYDLFCRNIRLGGENCTFYKPD